MSKLDMRFIPKLIVILCLLFSSCLKSGDYYSVPIEPFYYQIRSSEDLDAFFRYSPDVSDIIVCGHRGGNLKGYPENCIETFARLLQEGSFIYEIDLRLTKDGIPVLLHDESLDRVSNGKGSLKDYTYQEIQKFYLKDRSGSSTLFRIPSFEDALEWGKDKVVFTLDRKDVSRETMCSIIHKSGAKNCVFIVWSVSEAKAILQLVPDARFCAYMGTRQKFLEYDSAGLLPYVVIAFLETSKVVNLDLLKLLHENGIRGMVSLAPIDAGDDLDFDRSVRFEEVLLSNPDIIESDFPHELRRFDRIRVMYDSHNNYD